jgi:hypothetical protein
MTFVPLLPVILQHKAEEMVDIPPQLMNESVFIFFYFFFRFLNLFAVCRDTFSKWCVGKRGRVEECECDRDIIRVVCKVKKKSKAIP